MVAATSGFAKGQRLTGRHETVMELERDVATTTLLANKRKGMENVRLFSEQPDLVQIYEMRVIREDYGAILCQP